MPENKNTIESLKAEVQMLEMQRKKKAEKKALKKRIKQLKFQETTLGKVTGGVARFGEALTRPAQKTKEGKVIAGTGGVGAKVMGALKKLGEKKPAIKRPVSRMMPMRQPVITPLETAFAQPTFPQTPMITDTAVAKKVKKQARMKPFDLNKLLKTMPA